MARRSLDYKLRLVLNGMLTFMLTVPLLLLAVNTASAQVSPGNFSYPYNHLPWYTIESEHFMVHFQTGNSRSAKVVSRIAEEVHPHMTELYEHEPDEKVNIVLRDRQDYANGAAYFFDNKIDIWVPPLQTHLRGTHDWLRNVISHEYIHIIQLQASMKRNRSVPAVYFQWLSYEDVRRPDVLYGYPKGIISHPFASISIPAWFAEGTAQYQRKYLTFDTWDSHRDMILRTNLLNDAELGFDEMGHFSSKTSVEREMVYNQGFAFTSWLADRYGEDILARLSHYSAQSGEHNFGKVMEAVIGKPGEQIFREFTSQQTTFYKKAVTSIEPTPSTMVEGWGGYNFYPVFRPGTDTVAYLSDKGFGNSQISLYMKPLTDTSRSSSSKVADIQQIDRSASAHHRSFLQYGGKPSIRFISKSFSFSPDGEQIAYTTAQPNKYGEEYRDLYTFDIENGESSKHTTDQRIQDPAWNPVDSTIAVIQLHDGTQNLALYNLSSDSMRSLTSYDGGEQVYRPSWSPDGETIYFSYSDSSRRSIKKYNLITNNSETLLLQNGVDYRDAFVGPQGEYLYYSANPDGIFNIYRAPVGNLEKSRQLTSVIGGAFMPAVDSDGRLLYSEYKTRGYKIVRSDLDSLLERTEFGKYQRPTLASKDTPTVRKLDHIGMDAKLDTYHDGRIEPFARPYPVNDTSSYSFDLPTRGGEDDRSFYAYSEEFTDFTFYPVIRFDNYSKQYGSNGKLLTAANFGDLGRNLVRDFKAGVYLSSREITERLSIFGGALFGLGSQNADGIGDFFSPGRLVDLDRDMFLTFEYKGLPFIERSWSPTITLELFNLKRNVQDGLTVEEFPCTACMPDTTTTDIAYSVWEADLFLRSKLNRFSMLEFALKYTPYRVTTEGFQSQELEQYVPGSTSEYYKSTTLSLSYHLEMMPYYKHADIAPLGLKGFAEYSYEPSKLLANYEVQDDGTLSPEYDQSNNHTFEFKTRYGFPVWKGTTAQIYSRFFSYMNRFYADLLPSYDIEDPDDYFYLDYIGGYTGMRSYPFFALGGNTTAFTQLSYHIPLLTNINHQQGRYTLDKIFARVYAEAGNGWQGPLSIGSDIKTGAGAELRFAMNSHYLFPLKFFVSSSYGFNKFSVSLPDEFITGNQSNRVQYGQELLFHFGLTFDFEVLW